MNFDIVCIYVYTYDVHMHMMILVLLQCVYIVKLYAHVQFIKHTSNSINMRVEIR